MSRAGPNLNRGPKHLANKLRDNLGQASSSRSSLLLAVGRVKTGIESELSRFGYGAGAI